ncbi:MAG: hypothetical protein GC168_02805 [Candidatus Hydrogenedens sp.]|nr:hypothetical protein [Candidatus Hydrogenedens sp.]
MKKHDWTEELSALLDGEAAQPDAVQRAVSEDADLRARLDEYQRLGDAMRALPKPDVHPAFATRVMASIQEIEAAPAPVRSLRWWWAAAGLGAAAMLALVLNQGGVNAPAVPKVELAENPSPVVIEEPVSEETAIVARMAERMESGEEIALYEAPEETADGVAEPGWLDRVYEEVYAQLEYYGDTNEPLLYDDSFIEMMDELDAQQRQALDLLLQSYMEAV